MKKASANAWTVFWRSVGIKTPKRGRTVQNYRAKTDFTTLKRVGVDFAVAEKIYDQSVRYGDELVFRNFSQYFRRDPDTIRLWTNSDSPTQAFKRLFKLIVSKDLATARERLKGLDLIYKFYLKGERRHYEADLPGADVASFNPRSLLRNLTTRDKNAQYRLYGTTVLGGAVIIGLVKNPTAGQSVYKFIKLVSEPKKLRLAISMDSAKEYAITKRALEKSFQCFFDVPQATYRFDRLEQFLETGLSDHFLLTGVTFLDNDFRVTVSDPNGRPVNVTALQTYKRKIRSAIKKEEVIVNFRIYHTEKKLTTAVLINLLSYRTAGLVGAIKLDPHDSKMNVKQRDILYKDFQADFGIPLNHFANYEDLDEIGIYKIFLEQHPQKFGRIELRSKKAMSIYQELLSDQLLSLSAAVEEQARFCVNRQCPYYYKLRWEGKYCQGCKQVLVNGKTLITHELQEEKVVDYIKRTYKNGDVTKLSNTLLKRELYVAKISAEGQMAEFIPVTKSIKESQMEILKFRYPKLVIVTGMDNGAEWEDQRLNVIPLYRLVYSCKKDRSRLIADGVKQAGVQQLSHLRNLCKVSVLRITNQTFYAEKNEQSKYLGAELFEADCSTLLNYVFGNGIWLGAKYRGAKVPDGFTAFPVQDKQQGCFIWDAKFGEGTKLHMGNFPKNKAYIASAKKNKSVQANGGLRGFVFISNMPFPVSFVKKYASLVKGTRLKVTFLSAGQLQKIARQFRQHESYLFNNDQAKKTFFVAMAMLFFTVKGAPKVQIIEDGLLDTLLQANEKILRQMKKGKPLSAPRI